jgi:tripartite-type tricarboxylate transporter receptor subunit TctC
MIRTRLLSSALLALASLAVLGQAQAADDWPNRSVTVVVPVNAGGGADPLARVIFDGLSQKLGQSFVLDFRPGASMMVGGNAVAKSEPDGYTIMFSAKTAIVNASLNKNVPYDPVRDLVPVIRTAGAPNFVTAHANVPYSSFDEFIAYAKANPGKVNGAVSGLGGGAHAALAVIQSKTGIQVNIVPYSGSGGILPDLMSGVVDITFGFSTAYASGVDSGKLKYLAVLAPERLPLVPDVPSSDESSHKGIYSDSWYLVTVPAGTPPAIVDKLHQGILEVVKSPESEKKINDMGYVVIGDTPEEAARTISDEIAEMRRWIESGQFQIN